MPGLGLDVEESTYPRIVSIKGITLRINLVFQARTDR